MTDGLAAYVEGWDPPALERTEVVGPGPSSAFAALLDLDEAPRETLPPLWHWFHLLDVPRQADLGEDGHPAAGPFLPPIPDRRRMIAGGRLEVRGPVHYGDTVTRRSTVHDVAVKAGRTGEMVFVTVRHDLLVDGERRQTEEQDVVYRSQPAGVRRDLPPATPDVPAYDERLALATDQTLLFRFSALTGNAHRIHYDAPYATGVEGYPGLVVHGPLLALLMLEVPRRYADRPVTSVAYRLRRPVSVGATVEARGRRTPDGWDLDAGDPRTAATATVT